MLWGYQRMNSAAIGRLRFFCDRALYDVQGLVSLREQNKISQVSIGMMADGLPGYGYDNRSDAIIRLLREVPVGSFDSALLAGGWNLLNQEGLAVFLEAEQRGVEVHNAAIFGGGLLAGGVTYLYSTDRVTDELRQRTDAWSELAAEHGLSLPAVAVAFAALPPCVTKVVIGLSTITHARMHARAHAHTTLRHI
jgi:aryl-alcohol dehydrogenase-like predicted oxidoreductase